MSSIREIAEKIAGFSLVAFHDNPDAVRKQIAADIEKALRQAGNRVCDECESDLSDGSGFCSTCDNFTMPSDFYLRWVRRVDVEQSLRDERERALTDAARQECVFCAGVEGYNPSPVKAALPVETDAGNYVHRNDPPHGLAGVYCKAPRIRALITATRKED